MHPIRLIVTTLAICFLPAQISAHEVELGRPWCKPLPDEGNQNAPVGTFPGPSQHYLMENVALQEIDISSLIPSLAGRNVRMQFWLMGPNEMIAEHCHENRPGLLYLMNDEVKETKREHGKIVVNTLRGPLAIDEGNGTHHWWRNESNEAVLVVALDLPAHGAPGDTTSDNQRPTRDSGLVNDETLNTIPFAKEYPLIPDVGDYRLQARRVTLAHLGELRERDHSSEPTLYYVDGLDQKNPVAQALASSV